MIIIHDRMASKLAAVRFFQPPNVARNGISFFAVFTMSDVTF